MGFFDFLRRLGRKSKSLEHQTDHRTLSGRERSASESSQFGASSEWPQGDVAPPERRLKVRRPLPAGTRVLIVDDSKTIVAVLRRMLRENNCVTMEAYDAESALEMLSTERPDLIFLDIILPGMHGFEAIRHIRRMPSVKTVPIIVMSGNESAAEQFYAERIGANEFMKKPFSRSEVFVRMERTLLGGEDR